MCCVGVDVECGKPVGGDSDMIWAECWGTVAQQVHASYPGLFSHGLSEKPCNLGQLC